MLIACAAWALAAGVGGLAGCTAGASECERDSECPSGEYCVSGGGVFVSGGRCVPETPRSDATLDSRSRDGDTRVGDVGETGDPADTCTAEPERCNGRDDDCDGEVDEGVTRECPKDEGVCSGATVACENGSFPSSCAEAYGSNYETDESSCDGRDNDCDGETDEGCDCEPGTSQACGNDLPGICDQGTQTCTDQKEWGPCRGEVTPEEEVCDGKDNDCDGDTDESDAADARTWYRDADGDGYGTGSETKLACDKPSGDWVDNQKDCDDGDSSIKPGAEESCDGVDEDCDGDVDEGVTEKCSNQKGVCQGAAVACRDGSFPDCTEADYRNHAQSNGEAWENLETQNFDDGKDNDCDGYVDELFQDMSDGSDAYCGRRRSDGSVICVGGGGFASNVPSGSYEDVGNTSDNACVADSAGTVTCWGAGQHGETNPPSVSSFVKLSLDSETSCGLTSGGDIYAWGLGSSGSPRRGNYDAVACSSYFQCGRDASTRELDCWEGVGGGENGTAVESVATGPYQICAIRTSDGSIACWGDPPGFSPVESRPGPFQSVGAGFGFACGIRDSGELTCWGNRDNFDFPKNVSGPFEKVYASNNSACALHPNGRAECWYINGPCGSDRCDFP